MPQIYTYGLLMVIGALPAIGCGAEQASGPVSYNVAPEAVPGDDGSGEVNLVAWQEGGETAVDSDGEEAQPVERKIIYTARVDLVVEQFDTVPAAVEVLARTHGAFIANSSIDTASGRPRSGTWTIRVPVDQYEVLLEDAGRLGELQRRTEDSKEVTAEYYDVATRLRNKEREEERLLEHLASATGSLEEILAVEKELSRVRTESEQLQGQLRMLQDLTALSTVTIHVQEIQGYVPVESPTFATQIGRVWTQSLEGLADVGKGLVLAAVALAPWAVVAGVPIFLLVVALRRRSKQRATAP